MKGKEQNQRNTNTAKEKKNTQEKMQEKFDRQKILKYLQKQKSELLALRSYFSSRFNQEKNMSQSINVINSQIQNFFLKERSEIQNKKKLQSIIKDKKIKECLKNFGTNQKQSEVCVQNAQLISQHVLKWIQQTSKTINGIQQPLKQVERKSIKKTLTQKQVEDFKNFLKSQIIKFKHQKQLIMKNYCTQVMKGDCEILSSLSLQILKYKQWTLK